MRVVGAENHYIAGGPFMIEGMIYGIVSAFITMVIFYPISLLEQICQISGINLKLPIIFQTFSNSSS
ncbi:MAG: hypothetical protein R3B55_01575 [Candidatus Paceibacterota bacterium]